jgi:DNA repair exonuclease SbcCD ATPase subunit
MIPQRVKLKGFLCYKDEQAIDFEGNATLWMLSGLNGSGKSAIFDAVTYSLFGHHRGGGRDYHELINKDSDTLVVEFDFLLDNKRYRAKRTLKRDTKGGARGTQQMFRYDVTASGQGSWVPIAETGQKREFDQWVAENIGLSYDTFTSSVLLLQGKAEKLLDSKPEGRREVLASIVDLDRFERLHQKADDRRKGQESVLKALAGRLAALPQVAPLEVAEAKAQIAEAKAARAVAETERERLQNLLYEAQKYRDLQGRLLQARQRWERAQGVLAEAASIEQAAERLRELRDVVPKMQEISLLRSQGHQADEHVRGHLAQKEKQTEELAQKVAALKQAFEKRQTLENQITRDETKHREVAKQLQEVHRDLTRLEGVERTEADLAQLRRDVQALPADPVTQLELAQEALERVEGVARLVPVLTRFQTRRDELGRETGKARAAEEQLQQVRARGEKVGQELNELRPQVEEAARRLAGASEQATEARTLHTQARQGLKELTELHGSKVCRHCGQALTAGHLEDEKRRRAAAVQAAEGQARAAAAAQEAARKAEEQLRARLAAAEKAYQEARVAYSESNGQLKQSRESVARLQEECATLHAELPEPYQGRVSPAPPADWLTTTYPTADDLAGLKAQARSLEPARRQKQQAEDVVRKWNALKAQENLTLENLLRMLAGLPADREGVRRTHKDLDAEQKALFKSVDAGREQKKAVERDVERLTRERDRTQLEIGHTDAQIKEQELIKQNSQRGIASTMKQLPPAWHPRAETVGIKELHVLKAELSDLQQRGADENARELDQARHGLEVLRQDVRQLEAQEAKHPPEVRQDPGAIKAAQAEAKERDAACDEVLRAAQKKLDRLQDYLQQREEIDTEYKQVEKDLQSHRLLAELLGRERLQLYLVRQAERQVVEYANAVLDRLSGGQLYLKLSGVADGEGSSAKALELEAYNRATGERPINVAFLSGSQKFRVAVSLALGIGQYASRQHRPIESVIIDEGFGCLDSQGRQVMIQELQALRSQMRCILLVSHQEDFAESFADGYQFRLENGATRVERFQK